jgi:hypothetical protein
VVCRLSRFRGIVFSIHAAPSLRIELVRGMSTLVFRNNLGRGLRKTNGSTHSPP